jgi:hypothetical protein
VSDESIIIVPGEKPKKVDPKDVNFFRLPVLATVLSAS